jgi:hypothetical protein
VEEGDRHLRPVSKREIKADADIANVLTIDDTAWYRHSRGSHESVIIALAFAD